METSTIILIVILIGLISMFWILPWIKKQLTTGKIGNSVRDLNIKQIKRTIKQLDIRPEELFDEE